MVLLDRLRREALIKSALMLDEGEVETVSHYYAASFLIRR